MHEVDHNKVARLDDYHDAHQIFIAFVDEV